MTFIDANKNLGLQLQVGTLHNSKQHIELQTSNLITGSYAHKPPSNLSQALHRLTTITKAMSGGGKIDTKHINIFLTGIGTIVCGTNRDPSQGQTGFCTKSRFHCEIKQKTASLSQGRAPVCPINRSPLSQGRFLFAVCPGHRPAQNVYVHWSFLARMSWPVSVCNHFATHGIPRPAASPIATASDVKPQLTPQPLLGKSK